MRAGRAERGSVAFFWASLCRRPARTSQPLVPTRHSPGGRPTHGSAIQDAGHALGHAIFLGDAQHTRRHLVRRGDETGRPLRGQGQERVGVGHRRGGAICVGGAGRARARRETRMTVKNKHSMQHHALFLARVQSRVSFCDACAPRRLARSAYFFFVQKEETSVHTARTLVRRAHAHIPSRTSGH